MLIVTLDGANAVITNDTVDERTIGDLNELKRNSQIYGLSRANMVVDNRDACAKEVTDYLVDEACADAVWTDGRFTMFEWEL